MHKQMFRINKFELARYLPNISTLKNELETPLQQKSTYQEKGLSGT